MYEYTLIKREAFHTFLSWSRRLATCYGQWCSRADLSIQMMHVVTWTIGKGYGKTSMCLDLRVVCLFGIWKLLFFSNLMSKHYAVPKEAEGIHVWLHCFVFRATSILMSYLASGEGGIVLLGPAFSSLHPRWWESSTVKWRKKEIWAKIGDGILRSQVSTYEHFDTWQDSISKQEFKHAPVLASFVYFQWG